MINLIGYIVADGERPLARQGQAFDYIFARDGVYVRGRREGLEIQFRISRCRLKGLSETEESFVFRYERVPLYWTREMLLRACEEGDLEVLFHLCYELGRWQLYIPRQEQSPASCKALEDGPGSSNARAIIEVHSHHSMPARFSHTDNEDEQAFRIYGVLGNIFRAPELRVRVGLSGCFWEIPASWVFEMPEGLIDSVREER